MFQNGEAAQMINLGKRIKSAREKRGFTQERLAEEIGVSRTAVARWESGDIEPKTQNIIALSKLLNVSTDYLLGVQNNMSVSSWGLSRNALSVLEQFVAEVKKGEN